jgi:hypothetical protein
MPECIICMKLSGKYGKPTERGRFQMDRKGSRQSLWFQPASQQAPNTVQGAAYTHGCRAVQPAAMLVTNRRHQLIICVAGIYFCYLLYGYVQVCVA